jgi:hypothetical protein
MRITLIKYIFFRIEVDKKVDFKKPRSIDGAKN